MDDNLNLNTSKVLPTSSANTDGVTAGSLAGASMGDLQRGYIALEDDHAGNGMYSMLDDTGDDAEPLKPGFLGRPGGWER